MAAQTVSAEYLYASVRRGEAYLSLRIEMKRIAIFAALAAAAAAQTPDVGTIMDRVGRNQAQAVAQRQEFIFHQKQLLRLVRGNGKLAREENREYEVSPKDKGVQKELLRLEGKYEYRRSEERRVGKEGRSRWSPYQSKK